MITVAPPPKRYYLSYSAVRTFQACPLRYRFRYIDGLPEDCVSSSLVFGSAIHAAVEFFFSQQYRQRQRQRQTPHRWIEFG